MKALLLTLIATLALQAQTCTDHTSGLKMTLTKPTKHSLRLNQITLHKNSNHHSYKGTTLDGDTIIALYYPKDDIIYLVIPKAPVIKMECKD